MLAVRNIEKGKAAADLITRATTGASVEVQELDLSSLESIRSAADELRSKYPSIDLLINNAGVMFTPKSTTKDGFELQFGTNHLGHFAFTNLLLDRVLAAPGSRVVTVSSIGHRFARRGIRFDDLQWENGYSRVGAYGQAKLANLLFTYELQRRLQGTDTIAVAAHPGGSRTELTRNLPPLVAAREQAGGAALPERRDGRTADAAGGNRSGRARRAVLRPRRIRRTAGLPEGRRVQRRVPRHRRAAPAVDGVGGADFGGGPRRLNVAEPQPIARRGRHSDPVTVPGLGLLSLSGFQDPVWLFALAAPAVLLAVYLAAQGRRRQRMRRFADLAVVPSVAPARPSPWRHLPMAVLLLALLPLTIALAQPSRDVRVPRNRAVIMLVVDVSQSMMATDVPPNRLAAAKQAAQQFAEHVTPGVNLGLIAFAGTANVLVSPNPDHQATVKALDNLRPDDRTATGGAIFAALQAIQTVNAVLMGPGDQPAPARIVLLSDGKENKPDNPNNTDGAYTAARAARAQGVPISTIAFGTATGHVAVNNETVPVPGGRRHDEGRRATLGWADLDRRNHRRAQRQVQRARRPNGLSDCARLCERRLVAAGGHRRRYRGGARAADQPQTARLKLSPAASGSAAPRPAGPRSDSPHQAGSMRHWHRRASSGSR